MSTSTGTPSVASFASTPNTALTVVLATLPISSLQNVYIYNLQITRASSAAVTGTGILNITSTGLPGALQWNVGNAIAAGGTNVDVSLSFPVDRPLISTSATASANNVVSIVLPAAGAGVVWNVNVQYNVA